MKLIAKGYLSWIERPGCYVVGLNFPLSEFIPSGDIEHNIIKELYNCILYQTSIT